MKKINLKNTSISALLILLNLKSFALTNPELGVVLGNPTGLSSKFKIDNNHSVDAVVAYSLHSHYGLNLHADYIVDRAHTFSLQTASPLEVYYGIGARLIGISYGEHDGSVAIGPRAPIGLQYFLKNERILFFGELALTFDVIPETRADLEWGLGVRYRF